MLGKKQYVELHSPEMDQKIRDRYRSEVEALEMQGYTWYSGCGESFSAFRLLLILPVLMILLMLIKREILRRHGNSRIMMCYPALLSKDRTTLATPFALGTKFYTSFSDGTGLISATLDGTDVDRKLITKRYYGANGFDIRQVAFRHQDMLGKFVAEGRQPVPQVGFDTYADISEKEEAAS